MNTNEMIIASIVIGVFCFVVSFIFFNKVVKLDKNQKAGDNKDLLPLMTNDNYGKFWFNEQIKTVSKMMEVNALLKLIKEEGIIVQAKDAEKKLVGIDGIDELTQYFVKGSESNKKLFAKVKSNDVGGVEDFAQKSLDYLGYFFTQNDLIDTITKAINYEKHITENYSSYSKAKRRITDLDLYLLVLNKTRARCKEEGSKLVTEIETNEACAS